MKRKHLAAIAAALALAVASCGGDDSPDEPAPAAGTSAPAQTEEPDGSTVSTPQSSSEKAKNGDGGSSAAEAKRAAGADRDDNPPAGGDGAESSKPKAKAKTPEEQLATLSPARRRALHKDLYQQGKTLCYTYGPEEVAKSVNIPSRDPEEIARQYARAYEKSTPALALPYQQGCIAGFKRRERNPPKN